MRIRPCFIDTSFIVARFNRDDEHHAEAVALLEKVARGREAYRFITSDHVIDESINNYPMPDGKA